MKEKKNYFYVSKAGWVVGGGVWKSSGLIMLASLPPMRSMF